MDIRDIEKIVDKLHENHPFFTGTKEQLTYELLATFEDLCSLAVMGGMFNPCSLSKIVEYLDALNQALYWVEKSNLPTCGPQISLDITEERYNQCASLLNDYAYPYSVICSGYISYSRKRLHAKVVNNTVTFELPDDYNNSTWSDILREAHQSTLGGLIESIDFLKIEKANIELQEKVHIDDGYLCYDISNDILDPFLEFANIQWETTKSLPVDWKFDKFTLDDYRQTWICIAALCYVHFFGNFKINDPFVRLRNSTIVMPYNEVVNYVVAISGLGKEVVENIVNYIIFEPSKQNVDIMYQPIVRLNNDTLIVTPMLFIDSRPERNLLAVVSSRTELAHSKEVNDLENLMIQEIETVVPHLNSLKIAKHKNLGDRLPDVDFGILDTVSRSALLCELKWFSAADSSKEVYAREDDITHGCEQSDAIMTYVMNNRSHFMKRVFNYDDGESIDLFCCVVAKNNIRTQHKYVPVIDLESFKKLILSKPMNIVFHMIRSHEYEKPMPENASITYKSVQYGDFTFNIPGICFESIPL